MSANDKNGHILGPEGAITDANKRAPLDLSDHHDILAAEEETQMVFSQTQTFDGRWTIKNALRLFPEKPSSTDFPTLKSPVFGGRWRALLNGRRETKNRFRLALRVLPTHDHEDKHRNTMNNDGNHAWYREGIYRLRVELHGPKGQPKLRCIHPKASFASLTKDSRSTTGQFHWVLEPVEIIFNEVVLRKYLIDDTLSFIISITEESDAILLDIPKQITDSTRDEDEDGKNEY